MFAMPGLRAFSLTARGQNGVSCDADGVYVGDVPLLTCSKTSGANKSWVVRPISQLNDELSTLYRLPIDAARKANALTLIATAFNRGDMAMAAIATVQMQFPDPPPLAKGVESGAEIERRTTGLYHSALLKFWDPAKHPRTGTPPNRAWFAPVGEEAGAATVVPVSEYRTPGRPWEHRPPIVGGFGGGGGGIQLEFPFQIPRFWSRPTITEVPQRQPTVRQWSPPITETQPRLPFQEELPAELGPYVKKTYGKFRSPNLTMELKSGYDGPAAVMPEDSPGFDGVTLIHVEGHAAALMRHYGIKDATLYINNPEICDSCRRLLPKMLPPGSTLRIVLPDGTVEPFEGLVP
jgi:SCP1.201-like deaminase